VSLKTPSRVLDQVHVAVAVKVHVEVQVNEYD
jgi:hypothetical protein